MRNAEGTAFEETMAKAVKGDVEAQLKVARFYSNGSGVTKDEVEKVKWVRKAAEQNYALAQCLLGVCYRDGQGAAKDEVEAVKWFQKAAEQNCALAQCLLGSCYADSNGVAKDEVEAVKWFLKAARQNNAEAQYNVGISYANGRGTAKDEVEAVKWFGKAAAEQNYAKAQYQLGLCYSKGQGVTKDEAEAVEWFRRAADQNDAEGQAYLGVHYFLGQGVAKNQVEGYKWLSLATAQGYERAKKVLTAQETVMTPEQIAKGQRLAREFKPRKALNSRDSASERSVADSCLAASGTGFFITETGYLISNYHVIKHAAQVRLFTSVGIISARVVKVDAANDLALLKAEGRFAALPVAASRGVKLGGTVATVGFPNIGLQGFAPKLAKGEIAALSGAGDDARYFQISVPVQPGNSGGALVDERGNVVGVVSAKLNASAALAMSGTLPENVNYTVKSSYLLSFLESVPEVAAKLKEPSTKEKKFEDVVKEAEQAAVLVLVY